MISRIKRGKTSEEEGNIKKIKEILREFRTEIEKLYSKKLEKVMLYGSWARGDATKESDIDLIIIIKGKVLPGNR